MNRTVAQRWIVTLVVMSLFLGACGAGSPAEAPGAPAGAEGVPLAGEEPTAPSSASEGPLTATADSPISVQLEWKPIDGATGYDVEFSMGGGERMLLATLDGAATAFEDFGVPEGVPLTYHLTPRDSSGLTYSVTLATPIDPPNPYSVEPVLEQPGVNIGGFDPTTTDFENFDPSTLDFSDFDPSLFEGITEENFDPSMFLQEAGASATIGPEGGELVAEAKSGARFTLTIPAGALDEPTYIVMTPIESIGGYPFSGGMTAAVQIEPSGIELDVPARLVIEAGQDAGDDAAGLVDVAYAFDQGGSNFHLTPFVVDGSMAAGDSGLGKLARSAERPHAAGPLAEIAASQLQPQGLGKATPAEVRKFAKQHPPAGPRNRAAQKLAVGQVRVFPNDRDIPALDDLDPDDPVPLWDQVGRKIRLQAAAANSCKELLAVFQEYQEYAASSSDRETSNRVNNQILNDLVTEARSILESEKQKCLSPQACAQALAGMLTEPKGTGQERLAEAFAQKYPAQSDQILKQTEEMTKSCKLEMVIESNISFQTADGRDGMVVTATVPLVWGFDPHIGSGGAGYLKGNGPVKYLDISMDLEGCTVTFRSKPEGSTRFFANRLEPLFDAEGRIYNFELSHWSIPGVPDDMRLTCPGGQPRMTQLGGGTCDPWCFHFSTAHMDSMTLANWTMGDIGEAPGTIAIKTYSRSIPVPDGGTITERTVLTIRQVK